MGNESSKNHFYDENTRNLAFFHDLYLKQETTGLIYSDPDEILEKFQQRLEDKLERTYPSPDAQIIQTKSQRPIKPAYQSAQKRIFHAHPTNSKNEAKVNAIDGRVQILQTAKWPYSVHGVVIFKMNGVSKWGTGVMIGLNIVLTAGHNLYDFPNKSYADVKSIQFLPGMNGQVLPFGAAEVDHYFVSPNYIEEEKEDYAILVLKEPIGEVTGYFGLACLEPEEIAKKKIYIIGYPADKVASKSNSYEMWGMRGEVAHISMEKGQIAYLIDTGAGQSGSGVWYEEGGSFYVCGVHVSGDLSVNRGTLLTRNAYRQIYEWIHQANSKELLFKLKDKKELYLYAGRVNVQCMSLLMDYNLRDLRVLDLSLIKMGEKEAEILAQNTSWRNLSKLVLIGNNLGPKGAKALAKNTSWEKLTELYLSENNIGAEGAKALAQNSFWNLETLDLSKNNVGDEGAKALAQNVSWTNLSVLYLCKNRIGGKGAWELGKNTSWRNLSTLDLSSNYINEDGLLGLKWNKAWKQNINIITSWP